jgi:hypothetical protein
VKRLVDFCEKCRYYAIGHKKLKGIDGSIDYIPQNICKLHHRIAKNNNDQWVPLTNGYSCVDFRLK